MQHMGVPSHRGMHRRRGDARVEMSNHRFRFGYNLAPASDVSGHEQANVPGHDESPVATGLNVLAVDDYPATGAS